MDKKKCCTCKRVRPVSCFFWDNERNTPRSQCKSCVNARATRRKRERYWNDEEFAEKDRARSREWAAKHPEKARLRAQRDAKKHVLRAKVFRERFPEKIKATQYAAYHLPTRQGHHKHHWSYRYENRLDIIWLTIKEHCFIHRFLIYDRGEMLYRTKEGVLLTSKQQSEEYYRELLTLEKSHAKVRSV